MDILRSYSAVLYVLIKATDKIVL